MQESILNHDLFLFIKAKDNKILDSLKMQSQALRLKEEEENLAKKNIKTQFSERLLNPTAGSRNLLRCLEADKAEKDSPIPKGTPIPSPTSMKSITAKELLQQHQQKLLDMKALKMKASQAALLTPQLGRGLEQDQKEFDLSEEVTVLRFHGQRALF